MVVTNLAYFKALYTDFYGGLIGQIATHAAISHRTNYTKDGVQHG